VLVVRKRPGDSRLARLGAATVALARRPSFGIRVVAWTSLATAARIAAATAVAASLGVHNPLQAGLLVTAALIPAELFIVQVANQGGPLSAYARMTTRQGRVIGRATQSDRSSKPASTRTGADHADHPRAVRTRTRRCRTSRLRSGAPGTPMPTWSSPATSPVETTSSVNAGSPDACTS